MSEKITWRQVLDSFAEYAPNWGNISKFLPIVQKCGYRYFNWNGRIYELKSFDTYEDTGLTVDDLD